MTQTDFYAGQSVLVTGGCGFIGSHIARQLVARGAQVTILDNLSTGSLDNITTIASQITFIHGSITDEQTCLQATQQSDTIFHLAAFVSVPQSVAIPRDCYNTNVTGTFNLLEAARTNGVSRFVFSSSSAVYGPHDTPCSELTQCAPTSPYGFSKLMGEQLCAQYAQTGLHTVCLRYFNVHGPGQNPHGQYAALIPKLRHLMTNNLPITLFGDGLQTRDFVPVSTVVDANLMLGMHTHQFAQAEIFNIGSGKSITLLQLVEQLKKEFPSYNHPISFAPARSGDIRHSYAVCHKYHTLTRKASSNS